MKPDQSFDTAFVRLKNSYQDLNHLVPGFVLVAGAMALWVINICMTSLPLMVGATLFLVLMVSIIVANKQSYGEAALALVAGILTVYTVEWTPNRFLAFTLFT